MPTADTIRLGIWNLACSRLGEDPIVTLSDTTERALAIAAIYDQIRDVVLSDYPWDFATVRGQLTPNPTPPIFGFAYSYPLPTSPVCLKFWGIAGWRGEVDKEMRYKVEGGNVLTNVQHNGLLNVLYTVQLPQGSETEFTPFFISVFALRLAAEVAFRLTRNSALMESLLKQYTLELGKAQKTDAQQGTPNVHLPDKWQRSRQWRARSGAGMVLPLAPQPSAFVNLIAQTSAPLSPATGTVVLADGVNWDPLNLAVAFPYLVWWNGSAWVSLSSY